MEVYLDILNRRKIKPTAIRLLILKAMMQFERAFSSLTWKTIWRQWINRQYPGRSTFFWSITWFIVSTTVQAH